MIPGCLSSAQYFDPTPLHLFRKVFFSAQTLCTVRQEMIAGWRCLRFLEHAPIFAIGAEHQVEIPIIEDGGFLFKEVIGAT